MGLTNTGYQMHYVNIVYGNFAIRCNPGTPRSVSRRNKMMQEVHEMHYDTLTGKLTEIFVNEGEYGKDWVFNIYDGQSTYRLQIPQSVPSAIGILARLQVINYEEKISIKSYFIDEKTHLVVYQNGKKLQSSYTKDNPNGLPPLERKMVDGKEIWDSTNRNQYFENMIEKQINRLIKEAHEPETLSTDQSETEYVSGTEEDELTF